MTIIRSERPTGTGYTVVSNQIINNSDLSWEARAVLIYVLSKPDNWKIFPADLQKRGNAGRDKIYRILKELADSGYILRKQVRQAGGTMGDTNYIVYDSPLPDFPEAVDSPLPDSPYTAQPYTVNRTQVITEDKQLLNNKINIISTKRLIEISPDEFFPSVSDISEIAEKIDRDFLWVSNQLTNYKAHHFQDEKITNPYGGFLQWCNNRSNWDREDGR